MLQVYKKNLRNLLLTLAITMTTATFIVKPDEITVSNDTPSTYHVGIFYTYTKGSQKILVPNDNDEWPQIKTLSNNAPRAISRPPLRLRDSRGKVKIWYDRDLIAFNDKGYNKYITQTKKTDDIKFATDSTKRRGALGEYNDDGYWFNVGTSKFVSEAEITATGIVKA